MSQLLKFILTGTIFFFLASSAFAAEPKANPTNYKAGDIFRDCSDCPEMVVIPAGSFEMGSPSSEKGRFKDESPMHLVKLSSFAMGKTEVTRAQFAAFVSETGYNSGGECWTFENGKYEERNGRNWRNLGYAQMDTHPAACLNWNDATAYTKWLSQKTGLKYRLPSEAEWEYGTRGNTTTARYWGESSEQACSYANVMDLTGKAQVPGVTWDAHNCTDGYAYTAPAGSFKPNPFGLYDTIGNVWEWVDDNYHQSYEGAPSDGTAWLDGSIVHVLRGGSWNYEPQLNRSATRYGNENTFRSSNYGFRLARTL